MQSTITSAMLGAEPATHGDAGQQTANRLELMALEAQFAQSGTPTVCTVAYRIPGQAAVQKTWPTTYQGLTDWLLRQTARSMERYGLVGFDDLLDPSSPIKVAIGRVMPAGNLVVDGNWPGMMHYLPTTVALYHRATDGDSGSLGDYDFYLTDEPASAR